MNLIANLKRQYREQKISKTEFVEQMHAHHKVLHNFSEGLKTTDIAKIEITDEGVVYTSREFGVKIRTEIDDQRPAPLDAFNFSTYEKAETEIMLKHLMQGMVVFDIGAHVGWYSAIFSKAIPGLKIHAFEPVPTTNKILRANLKLNNVTNCEVYNHGLSDKAGSIPYHTEGPNPIRISLPVKTLDETVDYLKRAPKFIRCSVEGAEFMVFKGGAKTLKEHKPIVFAEMLRKWSEPFGYHPNDMIAFFAELGYKCKAVTEKGLVDFPKMSDESIETNFAFVP